MTLRVLIAAPKASAAAGRPDRPALPRAAPARGHGRDATFLSMPLDGERTHCYWDGASVDGFAALAPALLAEPLSDSSS